MKTFTKIMVGFAALLVAFSASTTAFAQGETPVAPGGHGPGHGGPHGQTGTGSVGPLHDLIEASLADVLGVSLEEFEERRDAGETFSQIALDLGYEASEIHDLMYAAHQAALAEAVEQGLITAEQAERMANMGVNAPYGPANGSAPGTCNGTGTCDGTGDCLQDGEPLGTGPHGPHSGGGGRNR